MRTYDIEQQILFVLIQEPHLLSETGLTREHFSAEQNARIFEASQSITAAGGIADIITIAEHLEKQYRQIDMGYFHEVASKAVGTSKNLAKYCQILKNKYRKTKALEVAHTLQMNLDEGLDCDPIQNAIRDLMAIDQADINYEHTFKDAARSALEMIDAAMKCEGLIGITTGLTDLDESIGGYHDTDLVVIPARPAMGKAQPLTSNVLLESGEWKKMGDIELGDRLASPDGANSEVIGIYPQGERPIYKVTFSDGREVECDLEHLWRIRSSKFDGARVLKTAEIIEMLKKERFTNRLRLEDNSGIFGEDIDLGLNPWLLGFLIGDGTFQPSSIRFTTSEAYTYHRAFKCLGRGFSISRAGGYSYRITCPDRANNPLKDSIKALGLHALTSDQKFLPDVVFKANRFIREQLLAGLLESDGWIQGGSIQYSTCSPQLAVDIQRLVRSLGGCATLRVKQKTKYVHKGEERIGKPAHILSICLPQIREILESPRLLKNLSQRKKTCSPIIRSIEFVRTDQAQCIKVSHTDSLYITDGYAVTHNTAFLLSSLHKCGVPAGVISAEQDKTQVGLRLISMQGGVNSQKLRTAHLDETEWSRVSAGTIALQNMEGAINDKPGINIIEICAQARKWKYDRDIKILFVDYIQKIKGSNQKLSRTEQVTEVVGALKNLAKELQIPVVALAQVNRECEKRQDKRPMASDIADASEIEKEADVIMTLYRDEVYNEHTNDQGIAEINVVKNRHGPIGVVKCQFIGEFFQFRDFPCRPNVASIGRY